MRAGVSQRLVKVKGARAGDVSARSRPQGRGQEDGAERAVAVRPTAAQRLASTDHTIAPPDRTGRPRARQRRALGLVPGRVLAGRGTRGDGRGTGEREGTGRGSGRARQRPAGQHPRSPRGRRVRARAVLERWAQARAAGGSRTASCITGNAWRAAWNAARTRPGARWGGAWPGAGRQRGVKLTREPASPYMSASLPASVWP